MEFGDDKQCIFCLSPHICGFITLVVLDIENDTDIIACIFWLLSDDVIVLKFEAFVDLLNTLSLGLLTTTNY